MCDYYNYYELCDCNSLKINCIEISKLSKCRFFYETLVEFPAFRLLYKLNNTKTIITKESIYFTDIKQQKIDRINRNILFCCELCKSLTSSNDRFIVFMSMFEYILRNWNDCFRNRDFLIELLEKLTVITHHKNHKILEEVILKMYNTPVNDCLIVINSWKKILLDEITCSIY